MIKSRLCYINTSKNSYHILNNNFMVPLYNKNKTSTEKYQETMKQWDKIKTYIFIILFTSFISGCSGDCSTSEDIMSDPKIILIPGYDKEIYNSKNLSSYWIPTDIPIKDGVEKDITFDVLFNKINLCGISTATTPSVENIQIKNFNEYYKSSINVNKDDYVTFELNKDIIQINCANPDQRIHISDLDKCQNGYYKKDDGEKVLPYEGKTVELESYVVPDFNTSNFNNAFDHQALWNNYYNHHYNKIYNAFVPLEMIHGMHDTNSFTKGTFYTIINGYPHYDAIIPSKILIAPKDYEEKLVIDGKDHYVYSEFPELPSDDKKFVETQVDGGITSEDVQHNYWCRIYQNRYKAMSSSGQIEKSLNRNLNIDSMMINKMCDKFYYLDKPDSPDLMKYEDFEKSTLSSKPKGNTNLINSKVVSIMENMSYVEPIIPSSPEADLNKLEMDKIPMVNSRFFYMLNANIGNANANEQGNINTDYANCGQKSNIARCDANGNIQIPLDTQILATKNGLIYIKVGTGQSNKFDMIGNANIKITKTCPNRSLYGLIVPAGSGTKNLNIRPGNGQSFEIPLYESGKVNESLDKLIIKYSDIKNKLTASKDITYYLYLAIKDNGDADGYTNNTGSVKLKTMLKRDNGKAVTRFINRTIDKMMTILYGPENPVTLRRSGGIVNSIYNNMISSTKFQAIVRACAVLMITIYGISIVMGLSQFNGGDLLRTLIKFGIVFILLQKGSWDFFNNNFLNIFVNGPRQLLTFITTAPDKPIADYSTSNPNSGNYIFGPINDIIDRFIDAGIWKQIMSVLFAGPFGWIFFAFLFQSSLILLSGTLTALITYITSMTLVGIFISVAPLFIITLMFKSTTKIFRAWIKVLMTNSLNVIFVFGGLSMIGGILSVFINNVFGYGICTDCALQYHGPIADFNFCILYADLPASFSNTLTIEERNFHAMSQANLESAKNDFFGIPIPFSAFICFILLSHMTANLVGFFSTMAEDISSVDYGSPTRESNIASKVSETMKGWFGQSKESKHEEISRRERAGAKKGRLKDVDKINKTKP